jgi:MoaA/NifB/PqqE/SkfB family radical SAM enzyme/ADP-ribose pyrophosphatase YjhB (NUDIX family)
MASLTLITGRRSIGETDVLAPRSVDISLTGRCQLRCSWCWGAEHDLAETVTTAQWATLLDNLAERGTKHIVFTGGEPLTYRHLPALLARCQLAGMRTTLSTNGIALGTNLEWVLRHVDDLGIPIDGSTPEVNATMRAGAAETRGWERAIAAIRLGLNAQVATTVRTVIARPNLGDIRNIPDVLTDNSIPLARIRWKLYQVEPIGPHATKIDFSEWAVTEDECRALAEEVRALYPALDMTLQLYSHTRGRYFQVDPLGNAYGTDVDGTGRPGTVPFGNVFSDLNACIEAYVNHQRSPEVQPGCELIVRVGDEILLGKRLNCYGAGTWALPGGHLEPGERCVKTVCREAMEELGVGVEPHQLTLVGVSDDPTPTNGVRHIHFTFELRRTTFEPENMEPHRCEELRFFDLSQLPDELFPPHRPIIANYRAGRLYEIP